MTLEEIKKAVDAGYCVYWKSTNYRVEDWKYKYNIVDQSEGKYGMGLARDDGVTLNGKEEDFYMIEEK